MRLAEAPSGSFVPLVTDAAAGRLPGSFVPFPAAGLVRPPQEGSGSSVPLSMPAWPVRLAEAPSGSFVPLVTDAAAGRLPGSFVLFPAAGLVRPPQEGSGSSVPLSIPV
ncbi:hypothetical protein SH611_15900 [Geminicoccaceae bacterium 1502E]|nr:hypothetical protein [Geminicoccaceae bacterium 1502E]